jgi:class 3 adenylate cyclase/tetratricopeptide (TPR) repeat protein
LAVAYEPPGPPALDGIDLAAFVPRLAHDWVREAGEQVHRALDASMVFVDVSGFTALSERLAKFGRVGAEEITGLVEQVFTHLLAIAYGRHGSLIKFGGDALLILFTGDAHMTRAVESADGMRRALRDLGELESLAGKVRLGMSVGVHAGQFDFFLVGSSHRELVVTGPTASRLVELEGAAGPGEILLSPEVAARLPAAALGEQRAGGRLLRPDALTSTDGAPLRRWPAAPEAVQGFLPTAVRKHVLAGGAGAEHRQAAVAFIAFSGTDALLTEAGAEHCADTVDRLVRAAQDSADAHDIALLGSDIAADGRKLILAAGAPIAHADDADRILRAARSIVATPLDLEVRAGVTGGSLFAGVVGPPYRLTYTVMGDTVNLAARLAYKAAPGEVLATRSLTGATRARFEVIDVPPFQVKGKRDPIIAVTVGAAGRARIEKRPRLPLVGRDEELQILTSELERSAGGGRVVEIVGPAGIGKSRLVAEVRERFGELRMYHATCDAYEASTPYFPFRQLLRFLLGAEDEATPDIIRQRVVAAAPQLAPWVPLIGSVVDVEMPPTPEVEALDPRFLPDRLRTSVGEVLRALLPPRAILRIEDVHWMDEASRALLDHVLTRLVPQTGWLAIVTSRQGELGEVGQVRLDLEPLDTTAAEALAHAAVERGFLSFEGAKDLAEKAGGNPLFLQELLTLRPGPGDDVPDTVERLIAARLDQLAPADRELLRHAALLGNRIDLPLLRSVTGWPLEAGSLSPLGQFLRRESEDTYVFEHDLFREVAYAGLPYRRRRELHDLVGRVTEARFSGRTEEAAETLALHYYRAGRHDKAWQYNRIAAQRAADRFAHAAAARFLRWALDSSRRAENVDDVEVARTWRELGDVLELIGSYGGADEAYAHARRRAPAGWRPELWYRSGIIRERQGRYSQALRWYTRAEKGLSDGADVEEPALLARVKLRHAEVRIRQGREREAARAVEHLLPVITALQDRDLLARAHFVLGWALRTAPEADGHRRQSLALYEEIGDLTGLSNVVLDLGIAAYYRGDWSAAVSYYERAQQLRTRIGDAVQAAISTGNLGEIRSDQGLLDAAVVLFDRALGVFRAAGFAIGVGVSTSNLGRARARGGRLEEAGALLADARRIFTQIQAASFEAETIARQAEHALFRGDPEQAVDFARDAGKRLRAAGTSPVLGFSERVRGVALGLLGRVDDAAATIREARGHAVAADALYDIALADAALAWLLQDRDVTTADAHRQAAQRVLDRLEVTLDPLYLVLGPATHPG